MVRLTPETLLAAYAAGVFPMAESADDPELFWTIFKARMVCDVIMLPIFLLLFRPAARPYVRVLGALWAITPMLTICWMIYMAEGSASPYYAGLNIVKTSPSRMSVVVSGPVAVVSRAFNVHFARIRSEGREFVSADTAPSLRVPGRCHCAPCTVANRLAD